METFFLNTKNSKTNESHRFKYDLIDKLDLKYPNKNMALGSLSIYYTWKNVKSTYNNNKFKISAPTWNETFDLPDGSYNIPKIQHYIEHIIKKHETIDAVSQDDSIDSGNFSVRGYLPLIRKDSSTHMHGLAVYVKEGLPFARDLSLENSADSYLCFRLALLHSVSYFFFLYQSPSSSLCTVFHFISSNIDEVLSINPPANVFVFADFNVHHKDWLTYSSGTD